MRLEDLNGAVQQPNGFLVVMAVTVAAGIVPVMIRIRVLLLLLLLWLGILNVGLGRVNPDHAPVGAGLFPEVIKTGDRNEPRALRHGPDFVADSFP